VADHEKIAGAVVVHYFDDFMFLEHEFALATTTLAFRRIFGVLGFRLDREKSKPPADTLTTLGVLLSMAAPSRTMTIIVRPKPGRVEDIRVCSPAVSGSHVSGGPRRSACVRQP
jgi:hypothetical protein